MTINGTNLPFEVTDYTVIIKEGNFTNDDYNKIGNCTVTAKNITTLTCNSTLAVAALLKPTATFTVYVVIRRKFLVASSCINGCNVTYPFSKVVKANVTSTIKATPGTPYEITGTNFLNPNSTVQP